MDADYPAENLLTPGESFAAPTEKTVVYTVELREAKCFNMFEIGEAIEYGQRVRGFKLEALVEDEWKLLFDGKCIGYKWADYFPAVTTDTVKITVYDAKAIPLLRSFALYSCDSSIFAEEERIKANLVGKNLAHGKSAKINYSEYEVEVEFGGVYPFNTVTFNSIGMWKYEIYAFDGSNYQLVHTGYKPHRNEIARLPETVKTSYKMKLVTTAPIDPETVDIGVMEL
jgi:hypothetical protein